MRLEKVPLTDAEVKRLRPDPKRPDFVVWDDSPRGFGVRLRASGVRSYVVVYRAGKKQRRMTLGNVGEVPLSKARKRAKDIIAEARLGGDPALEQREKRGALTVAHIAEQWVEDQSSKLRASTLKLYRAYLKSTILPEFGKREAKAIEPRHVRALYRSIADAGHGTKANRVAAVVSSMLGWAFRRDLIPSNPAAGAIGRQDRAAERADDRYLSEQEVGRFLRACETLREQGGPQGRAAVAFEVMLLTAMRPSETFRVRWEEVDWDAGLIRLAEQKSGNAPIHLPKPAADLLRSLERGDSPLVFPSPRNPLKPYASTQQAWNAVRKLAGFDDPRPAAKSLRKSFASLGYQWIGNDSLVDALLRHAPATIGRKHYIFDDPAALAAASEKIASRLAGLASEEPAAKVVKLRRK